MTISRGTLSKIHVARQQLGLDDDDYRNLLARVAGVRSAKELTAKQANRVLAEFQRLGFAPIAGRKSKGKPHNFGSRSMPEMITKIEALLADMGLPWSYADAIAKQMFMIERCAWVREPTQLRAIISALHNEQKKRSLRSNIDNLIDRLGYDDARRNALFSALRKGWERRIDTLESLRHVLSLELGERGDE